MDAQAHPHRQELPSAGTVTGWRRHARGRRLPRDRVSLVRARFSRLLLPAVSRSGGRIHPSRTPGRLHIRDLPHGLHARRAPPGSRVQRRHLAPSLARWGCLHVHQAPSDTPGPPRTCLVRSGCRILVVRPARRSHLESASPRGAPQGPLRERPPGVPFLRHRGLPVRRLLSLAPEPPALRLPFQMPLLRRRVPQQRPDGARLRLRRPLGRRLRLFR